MATYVILSKISPKAFGNPGEFRNLAEDVGHRIRTECPGVVWKESYGLFGRFDVLDIVEADDPKQVAKAAGTAALLSGNRVVVGVGAGWMREEFDALGVDFATRGARFDEAIEVLRLVWSGELGADQTTLFSTAGVRMALEISR